MQQVELLRGVTEPTYDNYLVPLSNIEDNITFILNLGIHFYYGDRSTVNSSAFTDHYIEILKTEIFTDTELYELLLVVENTKQSKYLLSKTKSIFEENGIHLDEDKRKDLYNVRVKILETSSIYDKISDLFPGIQIQSSDECLDIKSLKQYEKYKAKDVSYSIPRKECFNLYRITSSKIIAEKSYNAYWSPPNSSINMNGVKYNIDEVIQKIDMWRCEEASILLSNNTANYSDWRYRNFFINPIDLEGFYRQNQIHSYKNYKAEVSKNLPYTFDGKEYSNFEDLPNFLVERVWEKDRLEIKITYNEEINLFIQTAKIIYGVDIVPTDKNVFSNPPSDSFQVIVEGEIVAILSIDSGSDAQRKKVPNAFINELNNSYNSKTINLVHMNLHIGDKQNLSLQNIKSIWHEGHHFLDVALSNGSIQKNKEVWEYELVAVLGEWIQVFTLFNESSTISDGNKKLLIEQKIKHHQKHIGGQIEWALLSLSSAQNNSMENIELFRKNTKKKRFFTHSYRKDTEYYGTYQYPIAMVLACEIAQKLFEYDDASNKYLINEDVLDSIKKIMRNKQTSSILILPIRVSIPVRSFKLP